MITFYEPIKKDGKHRRVLPQPSYEYTLKKLRKLIDKEQPEIVKLLGKMWSHQEKNISYAELRMAIKKSYIDDEIIEAWREDYAKFINETLVLKWKKAAAEAAGEIAEKHEKYLFDPDHYRVMEWVEQHSGELITQTSEEQIKAINNMVQRSMELAETTNSTVDSLAMAIRPIIGLTAPQAAANLNYYNTIWGNLLKTNPNMSIFTAEKRARERAAVYAARQHRSRAMTIARTELATAYNMGAYLGIKQAQEQGLMGETVKRSCSADDERVCEECKRLHGTEVGEDKYFITKWGLKFTPPYHPNCRDAVEYIEIDGEME